MVTVVTEFANEINFTLDHVGEQVHQWVFYEDDVIGLAGCILTLISEKADFAVTNHLDDESDE